ncbi:PaaI family thioesterase [Microbacterium sp. X-17]|uniref:PaaI family thioesterase n=1 Tax=Microbacterium sp. X-17 TaxID=3144404 RepID=UPI0031F50AA2
MAEPEVVGVGHVEDRTRTVRWEDPAPASEALRAMSGLDYIQAVIEGDVAPAPMDVLLGIRLVAAADGRVTAAVTVGEVHTDPLGSIHGGLACSLLETAIASAVATTLPLGQGFTSIDLSTQFLRAARAHTGELTCEATVGHRGRRIVFASGVVTDSAGTLVAVGYGSHLVVPHAAVRH